MIKLFKNKFKILSMVELNKKEGILDSEFNELLIKKMSPSYSKLIEAKSKQLKIEIIEIKQPILNSIDKLKNINKDLNTNKLWETILQIVKNYNLSMEKLIEGQREAIKDRNTKIGNKTIKDRLNNINNIIN